MVDQRLVDYAAGLLKKGYTASQIKQQLISSGYAGEVADEAINHAKGSKYLNVPLLLGGIILLSLLVGVIWFIIASFGGTQTDITLSTNPSQNQLEEQTTLVFTTRMQNTHDDPVSVNTRHDILATNELVQRETESITVRGSYATSTRIELSPAVQSGDYTLRTTIEYDDQTKTTSFPFSVTLRSQNPSTTPSADLSQCPSECNDFNACTVDTCVAGRCVYKPLESCCGDGICEGSENVLSCSADCRERSSENPTTITETAVASGNAQLGAQECAKIAFERDHDDCFSALSESTRDPVACGPIYDIERKDTCYLQFALEDSSVCANIIDPATQQTCFSYARYSALVESNA